MDIVETRSSSIDELPYLSLKVREERIALNLKQVDFAKKIGIGLKTLRKIEQGDLNVNFQVLNHLLNCLGLHLIPTELVSSPRTRKKKELSQKEILKTLKKIYPIFKIKYGVNELALFGSYAKGEESQESDIDILINFKNEKSLEIEGEILLILEHLLEGHSIDLTMKKNLHRKYKNEIEKTKIAIEDEV